MTNKFNYLYTEDDVFEALRERIIESGEVGQFRKEAEFREVAEAFGVLCYGEEMTVFGRIYYQNDMRRIIVEELDFGTVMDAYELFKSQYRSKGAKLLAWLILREHLSQDELAGLMVEYDMGRGA